MKGVLVLSHSLLAQGIYESAKLFVGDNILQFDYLGLEAADDPLEFKDKIASKIKELDQGEGVIILTDLLGGSPCNQTLNFINDKIDILTGVNLPMILDLLLKRNNGIAYNLKDITDEAKNGITNLKDVMANLNDDDDE